MIFSILRVRIRRKGVINMKKKIVKIGMFFAFCLIGLTGCHSQAAYQDLYHNEEQIVTGTENYQRKGSVVVKDHEVTSKMQLSGVETLWEIGSTDNDKEMIVDYDVSVKSGKYKIVFVDGQKKVKNICEGSQKGKQKVRLTKGKNYIKMVGVDSDEDVRLHLEVDEDVQMKFEIK